MFDDDDSVLCPNCGGEVAVMPNGDLVCDSCSYEPGELDRDADSEDDVYDGFEFWGE